MGEERLQNLPKLQARCDGEDEEESMRDGMVTSSSVLYLWKLQKNTRICGGKDTERSTGKDKAAGIL